MQGNEYTNTSIDSPILQASSESDGDIVEDPLEISELSSQNNSLLRVNQEEDHEAHPSSLIVNLPLPPAINKVTIKREIIDFAVAIGAASKGILGMGLLAAQLLDEDIEAILPLCAMGIGALGGVGFYRNQAHLGIDLWGKLFSTQSRSGIVQEPGENTLLLPQNNVLSAHFKTKVLVVLGSLGFSMVQAMSIILAGGKNNLSYALVAAAGVSNLVISPGNMIAFLNQLSLLKPEEIELLAPKGLAEPSHSFLKKLLTVMYAVVASMTNIASGTAFFLQLATLAYLAKHDSLTYKIPTMALSVALSVVCSAVAVGMNIDGVNKTAADAKDAGGGMKFLLGGGRWFYLIFIAIANSLPSNYTGILSTSVTIQKIAEMFGFNGVTPLETIIRKHHLPKDPVNISIDASLLLVLSSGFLAQTLNKAPAAKKLLVDIGSVAMTVCRSAKAYCLSSARKLFTRSEPSSPSSPSSPIVQSSSAFIFNQQDDNPRQISNPLSSETAAVPR